MKQCIFLHLACVAVIIMQPLWKIVWQFLINLNIYLSFEPWTSTPRYLPKENENQYLQKPLYIHSSYNSYIHISQKLGKTLIFISGWVDWINNCGLIKQWNSNQQWKRMNSCMQHGRISETLCWVKEATEEYILLNESIDMKFFKKCKVNNTLW